MVDEKKITKEEIKNEELTDEQVNEAVGGALAEPRFACEGGCGRVYGTLPLIVNGKLFCRNCFRRYTEQEEAGTTGRL